jgi:GNAT superfamily N-acetyltransferase
MEIRFFQTEDTDSAAALLHEMSRHYNGKKASSREAVRRNLVDNILGSDSNVRIVVAVVADRVIGLATLSILYPAPNERAQLFMKELYVAADWRSQGIGTQIMKWIAQYAVRTNCARFDWTVDAQNTRAIAFYKSLGAKHVAEKLYFRFSGDELQRLAGA